MGSLEEGLLENSVNYYCLRQERQHLELSFNFKMCQHITSFWVKLASLESPLLEKKNVYMFSYFKLFLLFWS